jgi:hypothetical protein
VAQSLAGSAQIYIILKFFISKIISKIICEGK